MFPYRLLFLVLICFSISAISCDGQKSFSKSAASAPKHDKWDDLLKKYVSKSGIVNYKGFIKDSSELNEYLKLLSDNAPDRKKWSDEEQIAYWINAYNAFTIQIIIRHYPVKSIKEIGGKIPFVNSTWDVKFINIGGTVMDLNNVEHGILRKEFKEPRIHYAVNCASVSCPILRNEAYTAAKLNTQLDDQGKLFFNDSSRNKISSSKEAALSKIMDWYGGDFKKGGKTVIDHVNKYSKTKLDKKAKITYLAYNWNLNE
jgi:hypothetical protein